MSENCIFCKIIKNEIPSKTIYEDEKFKVILDIFPATKGHSLIIPKRHCENILDLPKEEELELIGLTKKIANKIMCKTKAKAFNILINTGEMAGQTVFHQHTHIIPRYEEDKKILTYDSIKFSEEEFEEIFKDLK